VFWSWCQFTDKANREALARLAELEEQDARLSAEKARALVGVADLFNDILREGRAVGTMIRTRRKLLGR
jgi:hypothetical protein